MSRYRRNKGIPDRWLDYTAVGKRLSGTRFIAFKVPLKEALNCMLPRSEVFGHRELLDAVKKENQELGLIIDLTYTKRYYRLEDVPQSLLCVKILTAGHEIPSENAILSFKRAVRRFLRDNKDNDKLIGVHCTHGLNRTGYLICRYLIDVDGMDPALAVQLFNSSRGHNIERQNYLEDLQRGPKRSNEGIEESEQEPQRGQAAHQPSSRASSSWNKSQNCFRGPNYHRPLPPPGANQHLRHHPHRHAFPPRPHLLATSPSCPPLLHPYRWTRPDVRWRSPPHSVASEIPHPSPSGRGPPFGQQGRDRAAPPLLPYYTPRWTPAPHEDGSEVD